VTLNGLERRWPFSGVFGQKQRALSLLSFLCTVTKFSICALQIGENSSASLATEIEALPAGSSPSNWLLTVLLKAVIVRQMTRPRFKKAAERGEPTSK